MTQTANTNHPTERNERIESLTLACTLPAGERPERMQTMKSLFGVAQWTKELPDGYAFGYADDALLAQATAFMQQERRCCTFFHFELVLEPTLGPMWIHVRGPAGTKQALAAEFLEVLK